MLSLYLSLITLKIVTSTPLPTDTQIDREWERGEQHLVEEGGGGLSLSILRSTPSFQLPQSSSSSPLPFISSSFSLESLQSAFPSFLSSCFPPSFSSNQQHREWQLSSSLLLSLFPSFFDHFCLPRVFTCSLLSCISPPFSAFVCCERVKLTHSCLIAPSYGQFVFCLEGKRVQRVLESYLGGGGRDSEQEG